MAKSFKKITSLKGGKQWMNEWMDEWMKVGRGKGVNIFCFSFLAPF
jgi:hypothetical protein